MGNKTGERHAVDEIISLENAIEKQERRVTVWSKKLDDAWYTTRRAEVAERLGREIEALEKLEALSNA